MRIVRRAVLPLAFALFTGAHAALAATPVSPAAGAVTSTTPTFVATLAPGEDPVQVRVSTSTDPTGSTNNVTCFPSRDGNRASCTLSESLKVGTYYWRLLYESNTHCVTVSGQRYCLPEAHLTSPVKFTVRAQAPEPPPPNSPPPPPPPTSPPPPVAPPPAGGSSSGSKTVARPTDRGTFAFVAPEQLYENGAAVVHYVTTGLDAPPLNDDNQNGVPDYVEEIGAAADASLGYYAAHQFEPRLVDGAGPDGRPDIYVKHFDNPDLYGLTVNPAYTNAGTFVMVSPHLDPSPKVARGSIDTVVSHELFHLVQYGYVDLPTWVAEGSAVAMSLLVYPSVEDLTNADYLDEWLNQTWRPLYDERSYCDHCYGGGLWWSFLQGADPGLLPQYFNALAAEHARGSSAGLGIAVLDQTMRARHDGSLADVFAYFSVALYRARMHPAPTYALRAGAGRTVNLNGLAAHYVPITVSKHARRITVRVVTRSSERPRIVLVVGGPKGRVVPGTSTTLRSASERAHVVAVISSSGPKPLTYRITART